MVGQAIDAVSPRKTRHDLGLMLVNAANEIVGHAEIERSMPPTGEKIHIEAGHSGTAL